MNSPNDQNKNEKFDFGESETNTESLVSTRGNNGNGTENGNDSKPLNEYDEEYFYGLELVNWLVISCGDLNKIDNSMSILFSSLLINGLSPCL